MNFLIRMVLRKLMRGAMKNNDFVGRRGRLGPRNGRPGAGMGAGMGAGGGRAGARGQSDIAARVAQRRAQQTDPADE